MNAKMNLVITYVELGDMDEKMQRHIEAYTKVFAKLRAKGVKIKILAGVDNIGTLNQIIESHPQLTSLVNEAEIRIISLLPYPFTLIDTQKVILKMLNPLNPPEFLAAIYLWEKQLAQSLKQKFQEMWGEATSLKIGISVE